MSAGNFEISWVTTGSGVLLLSTTGDTSIAAVGAVVIDGVAKTAVKVDFGFSVGLAVGTLVISTGVEGCVGVGTLEQLDNKNTTKNNIWKYTIFLNMVRSLLLF